MSAATGRSHVEACRETKQTQFQASWKLPMGDKQKRRNNKMSKQTNRMGGVRKESGVLHYGSLCRRYRSQFKIPVKTGGDGGGEEMRGEEKRRKPEGRGE